MKRIMSVVLVFLISVLFSVSSIAETIDLSQYNNDDLIQLYQDIQSEFVNRGMEKSANLPAGSYLVGKDIPAGTYIITAKTDSRTHGIIGIVDETGIIEDKHLILYKHISFNTEIQYRYELKEGYTLFTPFPATLTMSSGIVFK